MGGEVRSEISATPRRAIWLANDKDDRFGRLFVEFAAPKGTPAVVGASRVLFADSFQAAAGVLWGKHDAEATFRDGKILVLMSMAPDASASQEFARRMEALERELKAKQTEIRNQMQAANVRSAEDLQKLSQRDALALFRSTQEFKELKQKAEDEVREFPRRFASAPRNIVTHPAIFGREMAWSAARVDFWFNRVGDMSSEASMIGGQGMPQTLRNIDIRGAGADTWQFYELDSVVRLGEREGRALRLAVASKPPMGVQQSVRSHFGVSMFAFRKPNEKAQPIERIEDGAQRLTMFGA
jgi:hypothetical protein